MQAKEYLAHSQNAAGDVDPLSYHIQGVAALAAEYAAVFCAGEEARVAGLMHDLGKYGDLFQRRLEGKERGIDHWSAGAWESLSKYKYDGIAAALAVQGHHLGLGQSSKDALAALEPARLRQFHPLGLRLSSPDAASLLERFAGEGLALGEVPTSVYDARKHLGAGESQAAGMLDVRMLYSALVDADFVETEAFFQGRPAEGKVRRISGPALRP